MVELFILSSQIPTSAEIFDAKIEWWIVNRYCAIKVGGWNLKNKKLGGEKKNSFHLYTHKRAPKNKQTIEARAHEYIRIRK
jgi:aryl-phospho-beta-D-glucosidase BglC (GH1 family)